VEISYPDSNKIGQFFLTYEVIRNGADAPMLQALFSLCVILHTEQHENGRGISYYAASEKLFQPITDGSDIPEYRLEIVYDRAFENPERERGRINVGLWGFCAVRKTILRVPPVQVQMTPIGFGGPRQVH
jgi:hypothetical protein